MSQLFDPDEGAVARRGDPSTSWEAARSVTHIRESQRAVLAVLNYIGPLTDEKLVRIYLRNMRPSGRLPQQSVSGIRTRRRELVDLGRVEDTGQRLTVASGRQAIVWRAAQHENGTTPSN